jgi:hypothetical protein
MRILESARSERKCPNGGWHHRAAVWAGSGATGLPVLFDTVLAARNRQKGPPHDNRQEEVALLKTHSRS